MALASVETQMQNLQNLLQCGSWNRGRFESETRAAPPLLLDGRCFCWLEEECPCASCFPQAWPPLSLSRPSGQCAPGQWAAHTVSQIVLLLTCSSSPVCNLSTFSLSLSLHLQRRGKSLLHLHFNFFPLARVHFFWQCAAQIPRITTWARFQLKIHLLGNNWRVWSGFETVEKERAPQL